MLRTLGRGLGMGLLLWAGLTTRAAAVSVSPEALYIDHRTRSGTLTLYNPGTQPAEVEIAFAFGYPRSDAEGNVSLELVEVAPAGEPSVVPWLRAFPRRLVLAPGQVQTVRVLVQPPADLPDGEYWGRVLVKSRGGTPPIEQSSGNMRVQIAVETAVVTAVTYRKGAMKTGVAVQGASAVHRGGAVELTLDLEREGNAAFLGRARAQLVAPDGRVVAEAGDEIAVYRSLRRRLTLPLPAGASAAGYSVRYTLDTERTDLPAGGAIPAPRQTGTVALSRS